MGGDLLWIIWCWLFLCCSVFHIAPVHCHSTSEVCQYVHNWQRMHSLELCCDQGLWSVRPAPDGGRQTPAHVRVRRFHGWHPLGEHVVQVFFVDTCLRFCPDGSPSPVLCVLHSWWNMGDDTVQSACFGCLGSTLCG